MTVKTARFGTGGAPADLLDSMRAGTHRGVGPKELLMPARLRGSGWDERGGDASGLMPGTRKLRSDDDDEDDADEAGWCARLSQLAACCVQLAAFGAASLSTTHLHLMPVCMHTRVCVDAPGQPEI